MTDTMAPAGSPTVVRYQSKQVRITAILFTALWLVYFVQPVDSLLHGSHSLPLRVAGLAITATFSALYLLVVPSWLAPRWYTLPGLAALAALTVAACVLFSGGGAIILWTFDSSACGLLIPDRRRSAAAVFGCTVAFVIFSVTGHVGTGNLLDNLLTTVFVGLAAAGFRRQRELTIDLARAREEVVTLAASEERLRLARDMHDLTGQSLSMITLKAELAAKLAGRLPAGADRDRIRDEIEQVAAVSRQTLKDIREAISGYRRPTLAVESITARAALESAGITARDDAALTTLSGTIDPESEAALAWCLREAVTNVIRHSGANTCRLTLTRRGATLSLEVSDDGTGHACPPPDASARNAPATQGAGLHGMSERLNAVGGTLQIRPHATPGFHLIATVPSPPLPATSLSPSASPSPGPQALELPPSPAATTPSPSVPPSLPTPASRSAAQKILDRKVRNSAPFYPRSFPESEQSG